MLFPNSLVFLFRPSFFVCFSGVIPSSSSICAPSSRYIVLMPGRCWVGLYSLVAVADY